MSRAAVQLQLIARQNAWRLALESEARQSKINPGRRRQIPPGSVASRSVNLQPHQVVEDWQHASLLRRKRDEQMWSRFSGGQAQRKMVDLSASAIEIDTPNKRAATRAPVQQHQDADSYQKRERYYEAAAQLQERQGDLGYFLGQPRKRTR